MALTGKQVIVDQDQLPAFSGLMTNAQWEVFNKDTNQINKITADQIAVVGNTGTKWVTATPGLVTNIPELHGRQILAVARGPLFGGKVIYPDDPNPQTGDQILWDKDTDDLSVLTGNEWGGETLLIFHN